MSYPLLLNYVANVDTDVTAKQMQKTLAQINIDLGDIKPYISFSAKDYERNLIVANDNCELYICCWKPNQGSHVHDHRDALCGFMVLQGTATETVFMMNPTLLAEPMIALELTPEMSSVRERGEIHQIQNLHDEDLITMHVCCPPLSGTNLYECAKEE